MKLLEIKLEYIQKHTPEDNGDIESFNNSIKTVYIWVNDIKTFDDAKRRMEQAFIDYSAVRLRSSIDYLTPEEFESAIMNGDFREAWIEK